MFVWLLLYGLGNINLWLYFPVLSFPAALLCEAACPLDSFQWALQAVIHLWSWELVHLPPPFTSFEAASAGTPAVCHPTALPPSSLMCIPDAESAAGAGLSCPGQVPPDICQLTPCTFSPRHVLAAPRVCLAGCSQE